MSTDEHPEISAPTTECTVTFKANDSTTFVLPLPVAMQCPFFLNAATPLGGLPTIDAIREELNLRPEHEREIPFVGIAGTELAKLCEYWRLMVGHDDDFRFIARSLLDCDFVKSGVPPAIAEWLNALPVNASIVDLILASQDAMDSWLTTLLLNRVGIANKCVLYSPMFEKKELHEVFSILRGISMTRLPQRTYGEVREMHKSTWCIDMDESKPVEPFVKRFPSDTVPHEVSGIPSNWFDLCEVRDRKIDTDAASVDNYARVYWNVPREMADAITEEDVKGLQSLYATASFNHSLPEDHPENLSRALRAVLVTPLFNHKHAQFW